MLVRLSGITLVRKAIDTVERVETIKPRTENLFDTEALADLGEKNADMQRLSDNYFNLSAKERNEARREAVARLQAFVNFLSKHELNTRERVKEVLIGSNREILSRYFGLSQTHFSSQSGDKLGSYVTITFSKDGFYVCFTYADSFFFNSINRDIAEARRPKWTLPLRMCRGITFDMLTGELVSFPYEKIFNVGEYLDGEINKLADKMNKTKAIATEKVDGILIHAFYDRSRGNLRLGTKSQLDEDARGYINKAYNLLSTRELGSYCGNEGKSLMFELIDPEHRIVVGYKKPALLLHGVRDLKTSRLLDPYEVAATAAQFNLDFVATKDLGNFEEMVAFQKDSKDDIEGYVLHFDDGSMVKVKTESYFMKLKGLRAVSYSKIADSLLANEDWNIYKIEKVKSPELFKLADKYRADIIKEFDRLHSFLAMFVDTLVATTQWTKYGPSERAETQANFEIEYIKAMGKGIIDCQKLPLECFTTAVNHLMQYAIKGDKTYAEAYNKKMMEVTCRSLSTTKWMGQKLDENVERAITTMTLNKDFGGAGFMAASGPGQSISGVGIPSPSDKGQVFEMDKNEKDKRKKQKLLEDDNGSN